MPLRLIVLLLPYAERVVAYLLCRYREKCPDVPDALNDGYDWEGDDCTCPSCELNRRLARMARLSPKGKVALTSEDLQEAISKSRRPLH